MPVRTLVCLSLLCLASLGLAQQPPGPGRGGPPDPDEVMERHDRNGDGKISREEAPPHMKRHFDRIDRDGDGYVSKDELAPPAGGPEGGRPPRGEGGERPERRPTGERGAEVKDAVSVKAADGLSYQIVDTGQTRCYDLTGKVIAGPNTGKPLAGQDAQYAGHAPSYKDNGDGTVTDRVTGLMWERAYHGGRKHTFPDAVAGAAKCRTGGHEDWRLPTIKELYSLIDFSGGTGLYPEEPYLDTDFFDFRYGDEEKGERLIDAQYWSATEYVGLTMRGDATVFGVNFADGRIKGYPRDRGRRGASTQFVRYVRGNTKYGKNDFKDNGDGTITDRATGLMWTKKDSGKKLDWAGALAWAEGLKSAGHDDWRLPNAKELQSIVDYSRAPDAGKAAAKGPAIDPVFALSDPESYFWTGTTHLEGGRNVGSQAVYVAFGRALGFMRFPGQSERKLINVHGAGAQRSDPKSGDPARWSEGHGPQGDDVRILNWARAVRTSD